MTLYTILSTNIWQIEEETKHCWERKDIPKQLAKEIDPLLIYEVKYSERSNIQYSNGTILADNCSLSNPSRVDAFLHTHDLWKETLRHSGDMIQHYHGAKPEYLCIEAVKQNGLSLQWIEYPYQTEDVCMYAIHSDWNSLQFVHNQTETICRHAMEQSGKAIQYVRKMTPELCSLAIKKGGGIEFLQSMPPEVCRIAVEMNGMFLQYIPAERQTEELCRIAVENNPFALEWVHDQSEAVCTIALKKNGRCLRYVKQQTPAVCMIALEQTGMALQFVKEYMLPKLCAYALDREIPSIQFFKVPTSREIWTTGFVCGAVCAIVACVGLKTCTRKM
jgi:hypothetical protein